MTFLTTYQSLHVFIKTLIHIVSKRHLDGPLVNIVGNAVRGLSLNQHTHNIVYSLLKSPFKSHCIITLDTTHSPDSTVCLLSLDLLIPYDACIDLID